MEIPDAVRASVVRRLRQLDHVDRQTIVRAAAIGARFEVTILVATAACTDARVRTALERACRLQLLVVEDGSGERYAFRHAVTRDIVYAELAADRARSLHGRIARTLESASLARSSTLADVAHHAWLAGDARRARRFNELAGDRAASLHATTDARAYYLRAQSVLERDSRAFARIERKLNALNAPA